METTLNLNLCVFGEIQKCKVTFEHCPEEPHCAESLTVSEIILNNVDITHMKDELMDDISDQLELIAEQVREDSALMAAGV